VQQWRQEETGSVSAAGREGSLHVPYAVSWHCALVQLASAEQRNEGWQLQHCSENYLAVGDSIVGYRSMTMVMQHSAERLMTVLD
jgi:hypothetical protein